MANKLIIKNSLQAQIDASETVTNNGNTVYSTFHIDAKVGSASGSYESTYTDAKAIKYTGVGDVTTDGGAALTDGLVAFEGTATTSGSEPSATGVKAFYVKFDSVLGTCAWVKVFHGSVCHAQLALGESVCIPLVSGALASCKIEVDAFTNGVNEATVTVILIGD